jgi:hypothetical protein
MITLVEPFSYKSMAGLIESIKNAKVMSIKRAVSKELVALVMKMLERVDCSYLFIFYLFCFVYLFDLSFLIHLNIFPFSFLFFLTITNFIETSKTSNSSGFIKQFISIAINRRQRVIVS